MARTYGMHRKFNGGVEAAEAAVTSALQEVGFGILTRIDVAETLKKKIDVDRALNIEQAFKALSG